MTAQQVGELQHQVTDLLRQVASLKSQLNHTEATQKDFVQLSQSLQVSALNPLPSPLPQTCYNPIYVHSSPLPLQMQLAKIEEQQQLEHSGSRETTPT